MTYFQLATVSVNQTPLDWNGNRDRIQNALTDILERTPGDNRALPDCILFPELCVSGYGCEDAFHSEDVARRSWDALEEIADHSRALTRTTLIFLGLPVRLADRVYNCMAAVYDGRVIGIVPKANLAGDGVHYEPRWFSDYRESGQQQVRRTDREIPLGPLLFDHNGVRISLEICEDAWVAARPSLAHLARGVEIVLNPGASHFALGKYNIRRHIALESSRALLTVFAQVNLLGCEAGRMIYDGSSIVASAGEILYENRGFSFADFITNEVTLDLGKNRALRSRIYSHKKQETPSATEQDRSNPILIVTGSATRQSIGFSDDSMPVKSRTSHPAAMHTYASRSVDDAAHLSREMEFLHAVTLGLFDYLRRSRSRGFVISLSGGADSASCALLIQRMLAFAVHELGIQETLRRLGRPELTQKLKIEDDSVLAVGQRLKLATDALTGEFLHTVYQATDQSSETTRSAAATIAAEFNSHHNEVDVQELVNAYNARIESILKRNLNWEQDDLSLQNIQARVRSPMVWFLANTTGSLLIATSNRSEAAVGYCTMDGDTSGGLAPIAGIDKAFIQRWLIFMENEGDPLLGPVPALGVITAQQPTAELRPAASNQTDETDLMPYPLLDAIEKLAIRDRKSPVEVYDALLLRFQSQKEQECDPQTLKQSVRRFFQLWSRNQWKRERYAPAFHLDDENLDPRTWYRFPILSAGYAQELDELDSR